MENTETESPEETIYLTADEFIRALKGEDERFIINRQNRTATVVIGKDENVYIHVYQDVYIIYPENETGEFPYQIQLGKNLCLHNIINIRSGNFHSILINGAKFCKGFIISGGTFKYSFDLFNGYFEDFFNIEGGIFNGFFEITQGVFEDISINGGEFNGSFVIKGGTYKNPFLVIDGKFSNMAIVQNGNYLKGLAIIGGEFNSSVMIEGGVYSGLFNITNGKFLKSIYINGGLYLDNFIVVGGSIERIIFNQGKFIKAIKLATRIKKIEVDAMDGFICNKFILNGIIEKEDSIQIKNLNSNKLKFEDVINYGNIHLRNCSSADLYEVTNNSKNTEIQKVESQNNDVPVLSINDSDLGKTMFINCDFRDSILEFKSSKISDIFLAGTIMPSSYNINSGSDVLYEQNRLALTQLRKIYELRGDISKANDYYEAELREIQNEIHEIDNKIEAGNIRKKRDSHRAKRILHSLRKKLYESRGDFASSTQYQARELEEYRFELKFHTKFLTQKLPKIIQNRDYDRLSNWFKNLQINLSERAALWLNKISNYYGNDWLQGLGMTIQVTVITYTFYLLALGYTSWPSLRDFVNIWSYSLEFISPLPKSDDFNKIIANSQSDSWKAIARIWGWISRIIVAYFVYQTIQAFRKFGKKA